MPMRLDVTLLSVVVALAAAPLSAQQAYVVVDAGPMVSFGSDRYNQEGAGASARVRAGLDLGSRTSGLGVHALAGWGYAKEKPRNDQCTYNTPQLGGGVLYRAGAVFLTGDVMMTEGGCRSSSSASRDFELMPALGVGVRMGVAHAALELSRQDFQGTWLTLRVGVFIGR